MEKINTTTTSEIEKDVKQISLSIQQKAADKLNEGKKPYIASKLYVDYLNIIIDEFERELINAKTK